MRVFGKALTLPSHAWKARARRGLGWLLVALLLPGLARLPWRAVAAVLRELSWRAGAGLVLLNALFLALSAWRWQVLLRALHPGRVPLRQMLVYRLAGFAISYFTPGTQFGGEPLQVYALHRRERVPGAAAWASVGLDRLLDLTANTSFVLLALAWLSPWRAGATVRAAPLALLLAAVLAGWAALCVRPPAAAATRGWRAAWAQAADLCRRRPRALLLAAAASLLAWGVLLAEYRWMLHMLGLRPTWTQTVTMMLAARLAFLVPVPAGAGALEVGQAWAAAWVGWPLEYGAALSLLIRARDGIIGGLGLVFARRIWASAGTPNPKPSLEESHEHGGRSSSSLRPHPHPGGRVSPLPLRQRSGRQRAPGFDHGEPGR